MSLSCVPSSRSSSSADCRSDMISSSESILGEEGSEMGVPGVGMAAGSSFLDFVDSPYDSSDDSSDAFLFFIKDVVVMAGRGSCVSR
jgi:hypothetical protein